MVGSYMRGSTVYYDTCFESILVQSLQSWEGMKKAQIKIHTELQSFFGFEMSMELAEAPTGIEACSLAESFSARFVWIGGRRDLLGRRVRPMLSASKIRTNRRLPNQKRNHALFKKM